MSNLPVLPLSSIPQNFKAVAHFVKIANEYAGRDIVIYYWCMFKAVDDAMKIDSSSPEAKQFLMTLVDVLEQIKNTHKNDDNITQNLVAQSHIEDQAQKLFQYAKSQDDAEQYNQKMVKAFYTCGYLFDVLTMFGTLDENIQSAQKFAKWRATHIFGCLKKGEQPTPNQQNSRENSQQPNQFSGRVGDIAAEINDELSAELNALNASINGPPVPVTTNIQPANSFRNEYGFQPQNFGDGAYPNIGQQPNMFNAPRPGLQEPPFRPPPPTQQQPAAKPRASGQYPHHQPSEPVKPMVAAQMSPQPAQNLKLEDYLEAKKYTKFASSALDYEDPKTAIDYLQKAIAVLQKQPIP